MIQDVKTVSVKVKECSKCKKNLPATSDYFWARSVNKDGLTTFCKTCAKKLPSRQTRANGFVPFLVEPAAPREGGLCAVKYCTNMAGQGGGKGYCKSHYMRLRKYGCLREAIALKPHALSDGDKEMYQRLLARAKGTYQRCTMPLDARMRVRAEIKQIESILARGTR